MRKCPFWSSKEENIGCNTECPMNQDLDQEEECIFKECLDGTNLKFSDLIDANEFQNEDEFI